MKIHEIANINSGINQAKHPDADVFLLQAGDFDNEFKVLPSVEATILKTERLQKHYLSAGDLLILARGRNGFNAYIYDGSKSPAVAAAVFLVLKIKDNLKLNPRYLAWYINLSSTQEMLISTSRGSALPAINKSILRELEIAIPPLSVQQHIVALYDLKKDESSILKKLDELKTKELEIKLKELIK